MTNEQAMEHIKELHKFCISHTRCFDCPFCEVRKPNIIRCTIGNPEEWKLGVKND